MKIKLILLAILFYANICLAINPERNYAETPKTYQFSFKEIKLKTIDNTKINTWNITPQGKTKKNITIIMQRYRLFLIKKYLLHFFLKKY